MADRGHAADDSDGAEYRTLLTDPSLIVVLGISLAATLGSNVASAALPSIAAGVAVTDAEVGLVMTAYTLPAIVLVPVTGVLADIYGRRLVVVPALLVFVIAGTAMTFVEVIVGPGSPFAWVEVFDAILILRGIQGVGVAGIMSLSVVLLGDLYTGVKATAAQGLRVGSNGVGTVLIPITAGWLSGIAWNLPFVLFALPVAIGVATYVVLPETASRNGDDSALRRQLASYGRSFRAEATDRNTAVLFAGGLVRDFVRYAVLTFVPLFAVRTLDASFAAAGSLIAIQGLAYVVVSPFVGAISSRVSNRVALVFALVLSSVGVALFPVAGSLAALGMLVGCYSVGDAIFSPVIKDTLTRSTTVEHRSGIIGGMQLLKFAAQSASPVAFGIVLAVAGFATVFPLAGVIAAVYALAVLVSLELSPAVAER